MRSYIKQQFQVGFGRMQLVTRHGKVTGDSVSGLRMIMQVPLTLLFLLMFVSGLVLAALSPAPAFWLLLLSGVLLLVMLADRYSFSLGVYAKQKDVSVFFLPFLHLVRNAVWVWAFLRWSLGGA